MVAPRQTVLLFDEGTPSTRTPHIRGGKGAGLADMAALGLPVPPGFTLTSSVARAAMNTGMIPKRVEGQLRRSIAALEHATGRTFGDPSNPLLVSVRSGAAVSMPGMMDTILNVGLDLHDLSGLIRWGGDQFATDTANRFRQQFQTTLTDLGLVLPDIPRDPWFQLKLAISMVIGSWKSERAVLYRQQHQIPSWWGTAINVQAMVFGNFNDQSGTGVVFSANVATGAPGLYGEFLPRAQGEDVVAGTRTPLPISQLAAWNSQLYHELETHVAGLARRLDAVVDVEFTIEDGRLYLLQVRKAKQSPIATVTHAVHRIWEHRTTKEEAVASLPPSTVAALRRPVLSKDTLDAPLTRGLPASPGAAIGRIAWTSEEAQQLAGQGIDIILVRPETSPDDLPGMLVAKGIVTFNGGATSHAAVVARDLGIPAVVGASPSVLTSGEEISVDGTTGAVYRGRLPVIQPTRTKEVSLFLRWFDQLRHYQPAIGFEWVKKQVSVNELITDFYLTDAMARASVGTALERQAHQLRDQRHREIAECYAAYLLLAIGGEARHYWSRASRSLVPQATEDQLAQLVPLHQYGNDDRALAQQATITALEGRPDHQLTFAQLCVEIFDQAGWYSCAYGGKRWGTIARALQHFLDGTLSPTLFVDHTNDLRHNGGTLFDKHPMVHRLTNEANVLNQLDVKRYTAGISELARDLKFYGPPSNPVDQLWQAGALQGIW